MISSQQHLDFDFELNGGSWRQRVHSELSLNEATGSPDRRRRRRRRRSERSQSDQEDERQETSKVAKNKVFSGVSKKKIGHLVRSKMSSFCLLGSMRFTHFWPVSTLNKHLVQNTKESQNKTPSIVYKLKLLQTELVQPTSKSIPSTRSGHRMVADEAGDLYSFGGYNQQVPDTDIVTGLPTDHGTLRDCLFQELWKFNWRSRRWKRLETTGDAPEKLVSHCMCYWRKKIIIYGGTGLPYGHKSSNKLNVYHIEQNQWEKIEPLSEPSQMPREMYGQACVCDEQRGELYVVGGTDGNKYNLDVHKFNLYRKKWTRLYKSTGYDPGEPGLRYRHEIALHNNKLFIFGGSTNKKYYGFEELPVFDLETNDWIYVKTKPHLKEGNRSLYPSPRKCHSLGVIGNDCYMAGGTGGEGKKVCSDIWHINLDELKWTLLIECLPIPVYFHAASISLDGRLTIFGGVEDVGGALRNNKLTAIWLRIPSLKHICLSALGHYAKHKLIDFERCKTTGLEEALEVADT